MLVFALSAPLWAISATTKFEFLPGLPLAAVMVVCPSVAALLLSYRAGGFQKARSLAARVFDFKRVTSPRWYIPVAFFTPIVSVLAFAALRFSGVDFPVPKIENISTLALSGVFVLSALAEELGWSGYALEPLQRRWGEWPSSLCIGGIWAAWHFLALLEVGRSAEWIAWWTLGTLAARIIMVWLYNRAGRSVVLVALYHACSNLSWQLFPEQGSYFDPRSYGLIMASVAAFLALRSVIAAVRYR